MAKQVNLSQHFSQGVLWSRNIEGLDYRKDARYIINNVLMYGSLEEIRALLELYSLPQVRKVFIEKPLPVYTKQALHFLSKFILKVDCRRLNEKKYIKAVY